MDRQGMNSAATTDRPSWSRTLYVLHAAGVFMISRPIPRSAMSPIRSSLGLISLSPVPRMMMSGSDSSAGSRSPGPSSSGAGGCQSRMRPSAETMKWLRIQSSPTCTAPFRQAATWCVSAVSLVNLMTRSGGVLRAIIRGHSAFRGSRGNQDRSHAPRRAPAGT